MAIGNVSKAGPGSAGFGCGGGRSGCGSKNGFRFRDSIEIRDKELSPFSWLDFFKAIRKSIISIFRGIVALPKLIIFFIPKTILKIKKSIKNEREKTPENMLLEKLMADANKKCRKSASSCTPLKILKEDIKKIKKKTISDVILNAMDEIFYENFHRNMSMIPNPSESMSLMDNVTPPSIILNGMEERIIVKTLFSQSLFTQRKIVEVLSEKVQNYLEKSYNADISSIVA